MCTPVTETRTGEEFYVGNNGEANQSKYPIELRARLTRQNVQSACIIRYATKLLYYWCLYNICTVVHTTLCNNRPLPLTQRLSHSDITKL